RRHNLRVHAELLCCVARAISHFCSKVQAGGLGDHANVNIPSALVAAAGRAATPPQHHQEHQRHRCAACEGKDLWVPTLRVHSFLPWMNDVSMNKSTCYTG